MTGPARYAVAQIENGGNLEILTAALNERVAEGFRVTALAYLPGPAIGIPGDARIGLPREPLCPVLTHAPSVM